MYQIKVTELGPTHGSGNLREVIAKSTVANNEYKWPKEIDQLRGQQIDDVSIEPQQASFVIGSHVLELHVCPATVAVEMAHRGNRGKCVGASRQHNKFVYEWPSGRVSEVDVSMLRRQVIGHKLNDWWFDGTSVTLYVPGSEIVISRVRGLARAAEADFIHVQLE